MPGTYCCYSNIVEVLWTWCIFFKPCMIYPGLSILILKKLPKDFEQGCNFVIVNSRPQMKQVRLEHLFHFVSIFSNNYWAWIESTLTEEVYYSVKNVIRDYSVLKNDSGMTAIILSNGNLFCVFFFLLFLLTKLKLKQKKCHCRKKWGRGWGGWSPPPPAPPASQSLSLEQSTLQS